MKRWATFHRRQYREDTDMRVFAQHHHNHPNPWDSAPPWAIELGFMVSRLLENMESTMALIDDLQAKADATLVQVQRNSDLDDSIITIVTANAQTIKDLKAALDAAGTDPAKLQALSDTMDQIAAKATAEGQKTADAVTANTPAA